MMEKCNKEVNTGGLLQVRDD